MKTNILELLQELQKKCAATDLKLQTELNLTQAEFQYILASISSESLEPSKMANEIGISLSRISRVVEKLVQKNILSRIANKTDRRAIILDFTPQGKEIQEKIKKEKSTCESKITEGLSPEMMEILTNNLYHLINKLQ